MGKPPDFCQIAPIRISKISANHKYPSTPTTTKVICHPKVVPSHAISQGAITAPAATLLLKFPEAVERSTGGIFMS
jgi:hypothetical protein